MFKGAISAWATFWIGVVAAIIIGVTVGWQAGLIVFAVGLFLTVVQVILLARKGVKQMNQSIKSGSSGWSSF